MILSVIMNNIDLIKNFLTQGENNTLIVNKVSDEIGNFYEYIFNEFCKEFSFKIVKDQNSSTIEKSSDLFEFKKIYIYSLTNSKGIKEIALANYKKIIFTDYKNYKMLIGQYNVVNGYNFEKDIHYYFKDIHGIKNEDLINYCISQPFMIFSELSKYQINEINYAANISVNNTNNFILNFRKDIFSIKKRGLDIKKLFSIIKREAKYKKFSFLTY